MSAAYTGTLTTEHHQVIADIRDRLMAAGLSTERADRTAAEDAVRDVLRRQREQADEIRMVAD